MLVAFRRLLTPQPELTGVRLGALYRNAAIPAALCTRSGVPFFAFRALVVSRWNCAGGRRDIHGLFPVRAARPPAGGRRNAPYPPWHRHAW